MDRPRVPAEEDGQQVFLGGDLSLQRGDDRQRLLVLRLDLRDLQPGHHALLVAQLENMQRLLVAFRGGPRDLELLVERAQARCTSPRRC
jgi:hypothetical protein